MTNGDDIMSYFYNVYISIKKMYNCNKNYKTRNANEFFFRLTWNHNLNI